MCMPDVSANEISLRVIEQTRPHIGKVERAFWERMVTTYGPASGLPTEVFAALIAQESAFGLYNHGKAGELGAAQIGPWHFRPQDRERILNVEPNLRLASRILMRCQRMRVSVRDTLACYNGGSTGWRHGLGYANKILARVRRAEEAVYGED